MGCWHFNGRVPLIFARFVRTGGEYDFGHVKNPRSCLCQERRDKDGATLKIVIQRMGRPLRDIQAENIFGGRAPPRGRDPSTAVGLCACGAKTNPRSG